MSEQKRFFVVMTEDDLSPYVEFATHEDAVREGKSTSESEGDGSHTFVLEAKTLITCKATPSITVTPLSPRKRR